TIARSTASSRRGSWPTSATRCRTETGRPNLPSHADERPAATTTVKAAELPTLTGRHLGESRWHEVTQEQVNMFADATGDHQWIHVDPERAKTGPFGAPVAHGFLTLSMATALLDDVLHVEGVAQVVNYGLNKVRYPAPVPVGSKIRLSADCTAMEE